jgi:hypothetical protein
VRAARAHVGNDEGDAVRAAHAHVGNDEGVENLMHSALERLTRNSWEKAS